MGKDMDMSDLTEAFEIHSKALEEHKEAMLNLAEALEFHSSALAYHADEMNSGDDF